ncbi:MAG: FAD-binding oxidoreductase [Bdellovibrionales bacterium]
MKKRNQARFFAAIRMRLPSSQVVINSFSATDSSGFSHRCAGILYPESEDEVAYIASCANRFAVAIDPISTGFNVGYGDHLPESSSQVLVDLRRMNRILELNRREGWLRIQPGVSQGEVAEYLKKHAPDLHFDLTNWLKESSVVGNALERGRTLVSERENDLIGAKLALASGEFLRTGFNPQGKSPVIHGLNLHPLIFQSNLGIVVEGVLRVRAINPRARYMLAGFANFSEYLQAVDAPWLQSAKSIRMLRWYCQGTFAESPATAKIKSALRGCKGGVVALELDRSVSAMAAQEGLGGLVYPIARENLMSSPPLQKLNTMNAMSFFSFSVRRSAGEFKAALRFIESLGQSRRMRFYKTISFLDTTGVFLLRAHADPARKPQETRDQFREISTAIQDKGYILFRDHSGMPTKDLPDARLKKMIKTCFDPKGVISPGRYGLQ